MKSRMVIQPGPRRGEVHVPPSKSHEHRLLIANFLAGDWAGLEPAEGDNADVLATKRCLKALVGPEDRPVMDCGESGSTLRFLAPLAAALGKHPEFVRRGRLAERPFKAYDRLFPGEHVLSGGVSSQFVSGLLFALPLLEGDSKIRVTSSLESRGYVELTLQTLAKAGIAVEREGDGFVIPGGQRYGFQPHLVEGDWSGAAFWYGMNALGSNIVIHGLDYESVQPDRVIVELLDPSRRVVDVSKSPDIFPVLAVVAAGRPCRTEFTGVKRLRLKECDRIAAMRDVLSMFGADFQVQGDHVVVTGTANMFCGGEFPTQNDHRIAMAIAVGATHASSPVAIDDAGCVAKSYPSFFADFEALSVLPQ